VSTDISLQSTTYQVGNRQWLLSEPDVKLNVTLDPSLFTRAPTSRTASCRRGRWWRSKPPPDWPAPTMTRQPMAADGVRHHLRRRPVRLRQDGTTAAKVGISVVVNQAIVSKAKLPFQSGTGFADAAGIVDLKNITFVA
jgi:hypothetical protein